MIFKVIGSAVLLLSGAGTALALVRREKRKLAVLDAWVRLTDRICEQVRVFGAATSEILACLREQESELLADCGGQDVPALVRPAGEVLSERGQAAVRTCLLETGHTREEQIVRLSECRRILAEQAKETRDSFCGRLRLSRTLPLCIAAGLIILLW